LAILKQTAVILFAKPNYQTDRGVFTMKIMLRQEIIIVALYCEPIK